MTKIGAWLRLAWSRRGLSLREVEERSAHLASLRGIPAFGISASWLDRVESHGNDLSLPKFCTLALVYDLNVADVLALYLDE
jgi:hypothetical protein